MHPSRGSEYPDHRGMAKTEIPVERIRFVVSDQDQQYVDEVRFTRYAFKSVKEAQQVLVRTESADISDKSGIRLNPFLY